MDTARVIPFPVFGPGNPELLNRAPAVPREVAITISDPIDWNEHPLYPLSRAVVSTEEDIRQMDERTARMEKDVGELKAKVQGLEGEIGRVGKVVDELKSLVTQMTTDIANMRLQFANDMGSVKLQLQTEIGTLQGQVRELRGELSGVPKTWAMIVFFLGQVVVLSGLILTLNRALPPGGNSGSAGSAVSAPSPARTP